MPLDVRKLFGSAEPVVAMAHRPPLSGTPLYDEDGGVQAIVDWCGATGRSGSTT